MAGVDVVFNFCGIADIHEADLDPNKSAEVNILGNLNLLDACVKQKVKRYIFASSQKTNTIIFYNKGSKGKIKLLKNKGIKLVKLPINNNNLFDLNLLLKKIFSLGCRNILVEGGKSLTNSFIKNNLFNEFYLFKSPNNLGINGKLNVLSQLDQLKVKFKNRSKINSFTGNDIINIYSQ